MNRNPPPTCLPLTQVTEGFNRNIGDSSPRLTVSYPITRPLPSPKRKSPLPDAGIAEVVAPKRRRRSKKITFSKAALKTLQHWEPMGQPFVEKILIDGKKKAVCCFPAIKHSDEGTIFRIKTAIFVKTEDSGTENIGKIDRIFLDVKKGLMVNVYWYYRYNQCLLKDESRKKIESHYHFDERELIASKHMDTISCDSIQSHAFVLTFSEYCR